MFNDGFTTVSYRMSDVSHYFKKFYSFEINEDDIDNITTDEIYRFAETLLRKKSFGEFLSRFLSDSGRSEGNSKVFIKYCKGKYADSGIIDAPSLFGNQNPLSRDVLRRQLKNWFEGGVTPERESIFKLAFALNFTCPELEYFLKCGLCDRNINFKSAAEVAAYGSLRFGKEYSYALDILEKASNIEAEPFDEIRAVFTERFEEFFDNIRSEDELLIYVARLLASDSDPQISASVRENYKDLISALAQTADADKQLYETNGAYENGNISFAAIEHYLYGFTDDSDYAVYVNGNIAGSKYNKLGELKWFFSTLLRRTDLGAMYREEKKISRDTILTLAFFSVCENRSESTVEELVLEINEYLNVSRFEEFNFALPYDMFLYMCLQTNDPIGSFRNVWKKSWKE